MEAGAAESSKVKVTVVGFSISVFLATKPTTSHLIVEKKKKENRENKEYYFKQAKVILTGELKKDNEFAPNFFLNLK